MNTVFIITMLLNGVPQGTPTRVQAVTPDCRSEFAMLEGINRYEQTSGTRVRYIGNCVQDGR